MTTRFNDDQLSAFIDGELEPDQQKVIERALAQDPELGERVRQLKHVDRLIVEAYSEIENSPMPEGLMNLLQVPVASERASEAKNVVDFPTTSVSPKKTFGISAVAASVALMIGVAIGSLLDRDDNATKDLLAFGSIIQPDSDFYSTLESQASGTSKSTSFGNISVILSFKSKSGEFCREFALAEDSQSARALACRTSNGWEMRLASFSSQSQPSAGEYIPASAAEDQAFADALSLMMAEDALSLEDELQMLGSWGRE